MAARPRVISVGDICVDIKGGPLKNFSLGDRQFRVERLETSIGGNSANFATGAASLGLGSTLYALLGSDGFGDWLQGQMKARFVRLGIPRRAKGMTAVTYGLSHEDGTRQLISYNGANLQMSKSLVNLKDIDGAAHLHRSGFWWTPKLWGRPTAQLLRYARDRHVTTSLDIATDPEGWPRERRELVHEALAETDIFFANDAELSGVSGKRRIDDAAKFILGLGTKVVVAHLGPAGSAVYTRHGKCRAHASPVKYPANPIGSGDIFNAGFVYGRIRHLSLHSCAVFGNACAAYYMERPADPYPTIAGVCGKLKNKCGLCK